MNENDFRCNNAIDINLNAELYNIMQKCLDEYSRSQFVINLHKVKMEIKLVKLKINNSKTFIALSVKNAFCEIIKSNNNRRHESNEESAVYFKYNISCGNLYCKCQKTICQNQRGHKFQIDMNIKDQIDKLLIKLM
jgi:hypothetical protein